MTGTVLTWLRYHLDDQQRICQKWGMDPILAISIEKTRSSTGALGEFALNFQTDPLFPHGTLT